METTVKTMTEYGNCTLVQLSATPETSFRFRPGAPALQSGGLVISEADASGVVGRLTAVNKTDDFLLLTDADILIGAKQNRVLNRSVLLAPRSETLLDVSCIERGRWQYTTKDFSSPSAVADADLRKAKARPASGEQAGRPAEASRQVRVWAHISDKMENEQFTSPTESYADLIDHREKQQKPPFPDVAPEPGCNGLAVLFGKEIACIDLFGTEEVYRYYFPKLKEAAFLKALTGKEAAAIDPHEARFRVLDRLDQVEAAEKEQETHNPGAGAYFLRNGSGFLGFELECAGQLIHLGVFQG